MKRTNNAEKLNKESLCNVRKLFCMPCKECINFENEECPKVERIVQYDCNIQYEFNNQIRTLKEWMFLYNFSMNTFRNRWVRGDRGEKLFRPSRIKK